MKETQLNDFKICHSDNRYSEQCDVKNVNKLNINLRPSLFEMNPQHTTTNLKHTGHFLLSSDVGYHYIFTVGVLTQKSRALNM
jgi:hypothetical protein